MTIPVAVFITARVYEAKEGRGKARGRVKETGHDGIYRSAVASQCDSSNNYGGLPEEKLGLSINQITASVQRVTPPSLGDSGNSAEVQVPRYW